METATVSNHKPLTGSVTGAIPKVKGLTATFIICALSIMFSGIASMLMSVYLTDVVKGLLGDVDAEKMNNVGAYINAVFVFGSMIGGFAWGVICDKIGRSKAVILSTAVYGLFTVLTAFSASWLMVGVFRFITGFGVGGVILTTNVLVAEIWPEKNRAVAIGLVSSAMPVGFIAAGLMNVLLPGWHNAFLTGIVPLVVAAIAIFALPESLSWKANKNAPARSRQSNRLFAAEYKKNLVKGSLIFGSMLIGLWAIFLWTPTWVQSIAGDEAKGRELGGLSMIILASAGLAGSIVSGWIANAIGLRKTMIMCFTACFIMTFVVFKLNTSFSALVFIELGVLAVFFGISQGALSVFIPALFPTVVKASATGFCFNVGRIFTGPVVFFIGALVTFLGGYGNAVFLFSFIFLAGLAVTWFSKDKVEGDDTITAFAD